MQSLATTFAALSGPVQPGALLDVQFAQVLAQYGLGNVATIAALRANTITPLNVAYVQGYRALDDGGQGLFLYDASDTTSGDNGGTIIVDAANHRWKRAYSGPLNYAWFGAVGDGVADDTAAIQAAWNTGQPCFGEGAFKTSATLTITTAAQQGLQVIGAGPTATDGSGTQKTIIRPTAAVAVAVLIDGTGFGGYLQGASLRDLTIDMVNMSDASTSIAIKQIQTFGCGYRNVKVINDGASKRGWQFRTGAFTTVIESCKARIVESIGTSNASAVTTLTFLNHDGAQIRSTFGNNFTFIGGALQGTIDKFVLSSHSGLVTSGLDIEGTGTYLNFLNNQCNSIRTASSLIGFTGTYMSAQGPTNSYELRDFTASPVFWQKQGSFRYDGGALDTQAFFQSGGAAFYLLTLGRTANDVFLGVSGNANDLMTGVQPGDGAFYTPGAHSIWLGAAGQTVLQIDPSLYIHARVLGASTSYVDDAAAAAGGVPLYGLYRNGSVVQIRVV